MDEEINLAYFRNASGKDPNILQELGRIYIQQVIEMNQEMDECLLKQDWLSLSKVVHKAKYSAAVVGLSKMSEQLRLLEHDARNGKDVNGFSDRIACFRKQFEEVLQELKKSIPGI